MPGGAADHLLQHSRVPAYHGIDLPLQQLEQARCAAQRHLDGLRHPAPDVPVPSVASTPGSQSTARGWWNAPMKFFAHAALTATLPPMPLSCWASNVVGMLTYAAPRR